MPCRSIDMGPIKEGSSYCPQSEPVKRKVYAGSATYGRIQKTLGEHIMLRNSDGDTATDDTGECFSYISRRNTSFFCYDIN